MTHPEDPMVIAGDLGGTNFRLALVNRQGDILVREAGPTPSSPSPDEFVDCLAVAMGRLAAKTGREATAVAAVGLGVPGRVIPREGVIVFSPNLAVLNGLHLGPGLAARLSCPVVLENDANLFTLGEHWLGAGVGVATLLGLTLGTGVGGGLILNERLWSGSYGTAAEIGHLTIDPLGSVCHCGNQGCLETLASANWTVAWVKERLAAGADSCLRPLGEESPERLTAKEIFRAAQEGDVLAQGAFTRVGRALGQAIAGVVHLLGVPRVVIGGNFAQAWDQFISPLQLELGRRLTMFPVERLTIVPAALGDNAGLLGAARLAWSLTEGKEPVSRCRPGVPS